MSGAESKEFPGREIVSMQKALKFLHVIGSIGLMGSMAALLVIYARLPAIDSHAQYASLRGAMGAIADWIFLPSLGITIISGLLAFAVTPAFQSQRWALIKLAFGIILFEGGLIAVHGPARHEAEISAKVISGAAEMSSLGLYLDREWKGLAIIMAVCIANVVLGVWRPRLK